MKKVIIGLSAILISAFVVILAVNAQTSQQEKKKSCTEMSKDGSKCPAATSCCKMKYGSTAETTAAEPAKCKEKSCDPAKCKEMGCDPAKCKEGKCEHESCKSACTTASGEAKKCDHDKTKPGSQN
jgi:hypothetical protein